MGAALIAKPGLNRHFSVITFGLAQVAMDIEPGVGMLTASACVADTCRGGCPLPDEARYDSL